MINPFFKMSPEDAAGTLHSDLANGLDDKSAASRLHKYGKNNVWHIPRDSVFSSALKLFLDPATVLLIAVVLIAAIFGVKEQVVSLCVIVAAGAFVRGATYITARRIFEEKAKFALPHARILRSGRIRLLPAEAVTEGDIVLYSPGDTVVADCRIVSCTTLIACEKGITENSLPIEKVADTLNLNDDCAVEIQKNMLFAGSTILIGEARAIVTGTGETSYVSVRHGGITVPTGENMPVVDEISRWCKISSLAMIAAAALITFVGIFFGSAGRVIDVFISAMSLAAASMSEFLNAIALIVVASSMIRPGKNGAIIKNPASVDHISRCDTIVINSTSILKSGKTSLTSCFLGDKPYSPEEIDGDSELSRRTEELLYYAYLSGGASPDQLAATDDAVSESDYIIRSIYRERNCGRFKAHFSVADFTGKRTYDSGGVDTALVFDGETFRAISSGDVDRIFPMCSHYLGEDGKVPITQEMKNRLAEEFASLRRTSATVIAVAMRPSPYSSLNRIGALHMNMCFMGYIAISEAGAPGCARAVSKLREAGIGVIMLTNGPDSDIVLASNLGIYRKNDIIVTSKMLSGGYRMPYEKGKCGVVFVPQSSDGGEDARLGILRDIRNAGCKALLCGASLSDLSLIESADASAIVMQKDARSESAPIISAASAAPYALRDTSDILIMTPEAKGGLSEITSCIEECRGVHLKLSRCASFLLTSQLARLLVVLIGVFPKMYLLPPHALLIWGTVLDFLALLAATLMPPPPGILTIKEDMLKLPSAKNPPAVPIIMGVLWATLLSLTPTFGAILEKAVPVTAMSALIFASAALSLNAVAASCLVGRSLFTRGVRLNTATLVCALVSLGITLLLMLSPAFASSIGMASPPLIYLIIPPILTLVVLAVYEIHKKIK